MEYTDIYRSSYMKADDLKGRTSCITISGCTAEKEGEDERLVLAFFETPSLMVLDKTNVNMLAELYGPETSEWRGKVIKLAPSTTLFLGEIVKYIRICHERCDAIPID